MSKSFICAVCNPGVEEPDVDWCDNCQGGSFEQVTQALRKLDLEYQYSMLAHHASELIKIGEVPGGLFSELVEPLRRRLEVIKNLQAMAEEGESKPFAPSSWMDNIFDDGEAFTINQWPSSQLCMDCEHGMFIMSEDLPGSTYACKQGVQLGPCDSSCVMFEEKEAS